MATGLIKKKSRGANFNRLETQGQRTFVLEMLATQSFDATAAARKAGYKNPPQAANKLMKNPVVAAILGNEKRKREERTRLTSDDIWTYLHDVLDFDPLDIFEDVGKGWLRVKSLKDIPQSIRRLIEKVRTTVVKINGKDIPMVEVEMVGKGLALGIAAKHAIPMEHNVKHEGTLKINLDDLLTTSENDPDPIEGEIASIETLMIEGESNE